MILPDCQPLLTADTLWNVVPAFIVTRNCARTVGANMKSTFFPLKQLTVKYREKRANKEFLKITCMGYRQCAWGKLLKDQRHAWGVRKSFTKVCCNTFLGPRWSRPCSRYYVSKPKFRFISCPRKCFADQKPSIVSQPVPKHQASSCLYT